MKFPMISADSQITEPADTDVDHIDAKWRDKEPRLVHLDGVSKVCRVAWGSHPSRAAVGSAPAPRYHGSDAVPLTAFATASTSCTGSTGFDT
jgi:hypothetical protein